MNSSIDNLSLSGKVILIADDSPRVREVLSTALNNYNATVITAKNGVEAIALAIQKKPDMIIMDLHMPEMNGIDACKSLKSTDETRKIPILLSSSNKLLMEAAASEMSIADDFLSKPFSLKQLLHKTSLIISS